MYTIPKGAQAEAKRALEWRKEHKRGGTPVGLNSARTLAKGGQIGIEKVRHIAKYFPRHEVDKKAKGYKPGDDGFPSNGRIAWALWGGDVAWRWAQAIVDRENKKATTAGAYYDDPSQSSYGADMDAFKLAYELDETAGPEFVCRVRLDGSGIDRLYKIDLDGQVYVWDSGSWDDLGHVDGDVYTYDRALDDAYDTVEKDYFVIDPASAVIISARMQQNPFTFVTIMDIDADEALMVAEAVHGVDWDSIDRVITAAGGTPSAPAPADGYTPEERSQNAAKQARDAGGKFASKGTRVTVGGDSARVGEITNVDNANKQVTVQLDSGESVVVPTKSTRRVDESRPEPAASAPAISNPVAPLDADPMTPLDTSGILGQPRTPINSPRAQIPGTLPKMSSDDLRQLLYDYPAWVQSQRDSYTAPSSPSPVAVQGKDSLDIGDYGRDLTERTGYDLTTDAYDHPMISDWLKKKDKKGRTPNAIWYQPVVAAAEPSSVLTPETSDVQPMYFAIVSPDDPRAVLDLVSIVPASATSNLPTAYKRADSAWVRDEGIISDLNSATPPPVVPLDTDTLDSVIRQVDGLDPLAASAHINAQHVVMVLWGPNVSAVVAAGDMDRNRGNAEELRRYWTYGKGAAKIRWGKGGDWKRCVRYLAKYMGTRAKGYCQLRHKERLGYYTSTHAKMIRDARRNSTIEQFAGLAEPMYEVPVPDAYPEIPEKDLIMDVDVIAAEYDDAYDENWEPEEAIVTALDELGKCSDDEYQVLVAAGGMDRNRGGAENLRRYWTVGKGAAKIRWGTKGDWTRCVRQLSKYMGPRAKGYCALRHKEVTGMWTGDQRHAQMYGRKGKGSVFSNEVIASEAEIILAAGMSAAIKDARQRFAVAAGGGVYHHGDGARFYIPLVIPEDLESGDGRKFEKESIQMRELPLPLMWQIKTGDGHMGSVVVGRIDHMERTDEGIGNAYGVFDDGEYGKEAERLVRNGFIRGVSADMDRFEAEEIVAEVEDEDGEKVEKQKLKITQARVMGVTIVPKPAFQECTIRIVDEVDIPMTKQQEDNVIPDGVYVEDVDPTEAAAIVASGMIASSIPVTPPTDWFDNPKMQKPVPLTVTDDGRVFGHIAAWNVDHIGMAFGTKPPRSKSKYAYFHTGVVRTDAGKDVPVGQLTLAGGHAPLDANAVAAVRHYDDTASAIADVHAGEDAYGIWVAGALRPGTTPEQIRALRASAPSGDWRPIKGSLELVAVCQVNVPGFPIARARVASGQVMALVAAGANTLARMKSDPVAELTSRLDKLEMKEHVAEFNAARERFNALKDELGVVPVIADGYGYKSGKCAPVLEQLLSDVYSVYARAHGYHWNVQGQDFAQYHELFGEIYEDVYGSIDPLAENIRKMGSASPFNLSEFASRTKIADSSISLGTPGAMAYDLYAANEALVSELKSAFDVANAENEQGIADFIAERINAHQKWSWQLRASVSEAELATVAESFSPEDEYYDDFTQFSALSASGSGVLEQFDANTHLAAKAADVRKRFGQAAKELGEFGYSKAITENLIRKGHAMPSGSYPIRNVADLKRAIQSYGRSKASERAAVRRHIMKRARALGKADLIPEKWLARTASAAVRRVRGADESGKA
jgi:DNA-binding ferritin-like protein